MGKHSSLRQAIRRRADLAVGRAKGGGGRRVSVIGRANAVARFNAGDGAATSVAIGRQETSITQGSAEAAAPDDSRSSTGLPRP